MEAEFSRVAYPVALRFPGFTSRTEIGKSQSIEELVSAGYEVYVLSNGDPDVLNHLVEHANIEDLVSDAISASEVGLYKPDRHLNRHAAAKADADVAEIVHVTCA